MQMRNTVGGGLVLVSMLILALGACSDDDSGTKTDRSPATEGDPKDSGVGSLPRDAGSDSATDEPDPVVIDGMPEPGPSLTCDTNVPTTASCGGTECPAPAGIAAMLCTVPCCAENRCGTANTSAEMPRVCTASPLLDPSCPSATVMDSIELPGCCSTKGVCGVISTLTNTCITSSMYVMLPENPKACGMSPGGTPDAGATRDGG